MKVILQRDLPKVGKGGDVVNVADGYARNYLFPRQYAVPATGGAMKEHANRLALEKQRGQRLLSSAQSDAARLEGLTLTLLGRVGSGTKLYGSITAQDIADAIERERGVAVDKRRVGLADPIKTLGIYSVPVRLHSDVTVPVTVDVATQEQIEKRKLDAARAEAEAAARAQAEAEAAEEEAAEQSAEAEPAGEPA